MIWGTLQEPRMTWWRHDQRGRIGWAPQDSADHFAGQLAGKVSGSPVQERYQGGAYCVKEYTREAPSPADLFKD